MSLLARMARGLEWTLLIGGAACVLAYSGSRIHSHVAQGRATAAFQDAVASPEPPPSAEHSLVAAASPRAPSCPIAACQPAWMTSPAWGPTLLATTVVDPSDWDPARVVGYRRALHEVAPEAPLGRLEVPSINLSVVVLPGTDAVALNAGVGHVEGTAPPGEPGNVGIAGHRDGFFRKLERVREGDEMRLVTRRGTFEYRVEWIRIVQPSEVGVLAPTTEDAITLVTCYPFRIVGKAPQRYIVRARCAG